MSGIEFAGHVYRDDRMFVLYICKCSIRVNAFMRQCYLSNASALANALASPS